MKQSRADIFIEKARAKHGDRYDYSLVEYVRAHDKVKFICKSHGVFEQVPLSHVRGVGCPACANEKASERLIKSNEQFIQDAINIHGGKYCYSKTDYKGAAKSVVITCRNHGEFKQKATHHLSGSGCPNCPLWRDRETYIYIMTDGKRVKIGISTKPNDRLVIQNKSQNFASTFTANWLLPSFDEAYKIEQRIHKKLKHLNSGLTGFDGATEWFDMTPSKAVKEVGKVIERAQQMALSF